MGLPFTFPEVDSSFLNLYNRFIADPSSQFGGNYLDPSDPDFQRYIELAGRPTGSEELIREYVSRRPSYEEYEPSFGRRMASFLLGTLSGRGYEGAQKHLYRPLMENIEDWEREGTGITSRARLLDAERQRELMALRYGLQARGQASRQEAFDKYRSAAESRRMAEEVADEARRTREEETRESERAFRRGMSEQMMDLRREIHEDRQTEVARRNTEREERQKKLEEEEASLGKKNERLMDYASQRGIQTKIGPAAYMTSHDVAKHLALEDAMNHPAFSNLVVKTEGGYAAAPDADKRRLHAMKIYVDGLIKKYLAGEY